MDVTILVALIAGVAGPLLAYVAAARRLSGKINTSEATSLWQEASNLRSEYKDEVGRLRGELNDCVIRLNRVEEMNSKLRVENGGLNRTIKDQERRIEELEAVVVHLEEDNKKLRLRVVELETLNGN